MSNFFHLSLIPLLSALTLMYEYPGEQNEIQQALSNFPSGFGLEPALDYFDNWAQENPWENVWTASPETSHQIVEVVNWAKTFSWQVRASGFRHNWSPLSLPPGNFHSSQFISKETQNEGGGNPGGSPPIFKNKRSKSKSDGRNLRLILLKTSRLKQMGIISNTRGDFSFWAEPGVKMEALLTFLERNGMSILNFPATGEISLGGALAVGGHGTGVPSLNETQRSRSKVKVRGHTFGGLSNLIMSMTILAYNKSQDKYELKTLSRSDPEIGAFLVSLGRTFIVNVTMRAGPLQYFQCQNFLDIPAQELFSPPTKEDGENGENGNNMQGRSRKKGRPTRTISKYLDESGRVDVVLYAQTKNVWLKVWTPIENEGRCPPRPQSPLPFPLNLFEPKNVHQPYPYNFVHHANPFLTSQIRKIHERGLYKRFQTTFGPLTHAFTKFEMVRGQTLEFCGSSKNVFLYVGSKILRYHENGYVLLCRRSDVQLVAHRLFKVRQNLIEEYQKRGQSPINGPTSFRVAGVDDPKDAGVRGAESPMISSSRPVPHRPELDTAIWFNTLTFPQTPHAYEFYTDLEKELTRVFNGTLAVLRPEWSKGWAYTSRGPWTDKEFLEKFIPNHFEKWTEFRRITHSNDPFNIFTNHFLLNQLKT